MVRYKYSMYHIHSSEEVDTRIDQPTICQLEHVIKAPAQQPPLYVLTGVSERELFSRDLMIGWHVKATVPVKCPSHHLVCLYSAQTSEHSLKHKCPQFRLCLCVSEFIVSEEKCQG